MDRPRASRLGRASFQEVWKYNIDIAEEAAQLGFDEIQFDYVRFPDTPGLSFSQANTEEMRVRRSAVSSPRRASARRPTTSSSRPTSSGYVSWNANDTFIGQRLDSVAPHVDYLAPMLSIHRASSSASRATAIRSPIPTS